LTGVTGFLPTRYNEVYPVLVFGRYKLLFALTTALMIGAAAGFNFVIDPYGISHVPSRKQDSMLPSPSDASGGAYNASLAGGHLTELRQYLELAIDASPGRLQTVYFSLDFFELNAGARTKKHICNITSAKSTASETLNRRIQDGVLYILK
jgi:hypothetical protein